MNIQIFGTKKSQDTKKAERYFKERGISFQSVDMTAKGLSKRELESVVKAVGSLDKLLDEKCKDQDTLTLVKYLGERDRFDKVLDNPQLLRQPIVRNGQQATVGYAPEVWKEWK